MFKWIDQIIHSTVGLVVLLLLRIHVKKKSLNPSSNFCCIFLNLKRVASFCFCSVGTCVGTYYDNHFVLVRHQS